jgi:Predicted sulfurtransferase
LFSTILITDVNKAGCLVFLDSKFIAMLLVNRINKQILRENLKNEPFKRQTLSFYRYVTIPNSQEFRDSLYREWFQLNCFGRIYIANEGINAQMSVPEHHLDAFLGTLARQPELCDMHIKYAVEDDGKSFYKLTMKVRPRIVADGLEEDTYDLSKTGTHLHPLDFHKFVDEPDTIVVDMRNHYESEIGRFVNSYCPDVDTFKDAIVDVANKYGQQKDRKLLLYCTGGIRCEKASSYLIHQGFTNVFQLSGGIIDYAQHIKKLDVESKFMGKNFVFDERLGETINGQVISHCHQCGKPCDTHTNCANSDCHLLFIQCAECREKYNGCCSEDCKSILLMPQHQRNQMKMDRHQKYSRSKIFYKFAQV